MFVSILLLLLVSCGLRVSGPSHATGPVVVYKTKKDYRNHVMVQLSEDGNSVVAFPAPTDVLHQKPMELADGYLLKRMVGNAVTSLEIEAYANSGNSYSAEDLYELIIDKGPFLEIYECSVYTESDTISINQLIRKGELRKCKSLR
jgi:hypothetical protein